ncbi:histidinol-phosphatase [Iodidimonas gelatinilytica]|uniref:Histidinol-phosphatase n=1 Tax=Iodidimonas gelatinilytica TaxID=1236966 RepID=A0A5A7MSK5_9PROT|nr:histidinol-phosphatase [Iodidimonas gelatinilytica]GEQ97955.1 histidinol-phosphatase [Iodidimonas gelatinilytica]
MTSPHTSPPLPADRLEELAEFAQTLAQAAAKATLPYFRQPMAVEDKEGKAGFDPVTIADRNAEQAMRTLIEEHYPDHGIIGEEFGTKPSRSGPYWVLDPIDGTRAFVAGLPSWGTLIAFNDGTRPVIGVVAQPYIGEVFLGINGSGICRSSLNGQIIKTRPCAALGRATLSTTGLNFFTDPEREAFLALEKEAPITRYGFDCYAYAILATGTIDLVVEAGLEPYDIQALIPLIEGAGGHITTWRGGDAQQGGRVIAAGDSTLHAQILERLRSVEQK